MKELEINSDNTNSIEAYEPIDHLKYGIIGIAVGISLTLLGWTISTIAGNNQEFLNLWVGAQGFFLTCLGTWLILIIRSKTLFKLASSLTQNGLPSPRGITRRWLRYTIVISIGIAGTISVNSMGFNAQCIILWYLWLVCGGVCFAAGFVTLHAIDVLFIVRSLQHTKLKMFKYSPARTPELRKFVNYFTSFTLLMTFGYAFCIAGTLSAHWTASNNYLMTVQLFWPVIYVPTCSIVLIYPHVIIHGIIRQEKDRTLVMYQNEIDDLLAQYHDLDQGQVQKTNSIVELFDRISATPDYVIDFAIALRTVLPLLFNFATLFNKIISH